MKITKFLLILIFMVSFISCKDQEENEKLKLENEKLKLELEKEKSLSEDSQNSKTSIEYSINDAENYVKDYFSFYKNDFAYRNLKIRKRNSNTFDVRLEQGFKHNFKGEDYIWEAVTYNLEVLGNDNYNMSRRY